MKKNLYCRVRDIKYGGVNKKQEVYLNRLITKRKNFFCTFRIHPLSSNRKIQIIKAQYYKLLAEDQIESVNPEMIYFPDNGTYDVFFDITRNNRIEAEIGGLVTSKATNEIFFQIKYNMWSKYSLNLTGNTYLGRFHNSGLVQARIDFPGNLPLALELTYTLNGWNYFKTNTYFFEDEKPNYLVQRDSYWKYEISTPVSNDSKLALEFASGLKTDNYYQTNQFSRPDTADKTTFSFYSPNALLNLIPSTENNLPQPGHISESAPDSSAGWKKTSRAQHRLILQNFPIIITGSSYEWPLINTLIPSAGLSLGYSVQLTISNQPFFNNYTSSVLNAPSFEPIPESHTIFLPQFRSHTYFAVGGKIHFKHS